MDQQGNKSGLMSIFCLLFVGAFLLSACQNITASVASSTTPIKVVAAENFYGDIARQLGGSHVSVTSILSDPNADPHEFTSNMKTLLAVSRANLVIKNGLDYDTWMDSLLASTSTPRQIVLTAGNIAPDKLPDNPHVWYSFTDVQAIAQSITHTFEQLDKAHTSDFQHNLVTFDNSLHALEQKQQEIQQRYANTPVALTETIFLYQTQVMHLDVLTPFDFMKAVAEGNDPPANTVVDVQNELIHKQAKIVIYNEQTVTPITSNVQSEAQAQHIPLVPVGETMPPDKSYQTWMMGQLEQLEIALAGA